MKNSNCVKVVPVVAIALLVGICAPARADVFLGNVGPTGQSVIPALGGDQNYTITNGGVTIQGDGKTSAKMRPLVRPSIPAAQTFDTTLDYESWGNATKGNVTRISGNRITAVLGYTRGLPSNSEVSIMVPEQHLHLDGLGTGYGIGDIMMAYRKYSFDAKNEDKPTLVYSLRAFAPTGDKDRGLGLGKFAFGPLVSVSKPLSDKTSGYIGTSYTYIAGNNNSLNYKNLLAAWVGGITQFKPRLGLQYELSYFNSVSDEKFVRFLVGPRYALTPTRTLQLNFRQELVAAGKPRSISLGFASQF